MRTIIHFGLQKTATSFFQREVFPKLRGVCYVGRPYTQQNHAFNTAQYADSSLFDQSLLDEEAEKLRSRAQGRTLLISDEVLGGYLPWGFVNRSMTAERLGHAFPEAEALVFLRGQEALMLSLYNQFVKRGAFIGPFGSDFVHLPGEGQLAEAWFDGDRDWEDERRYIDSSALFSIEHLRYSTLMALYERHFSRVHVFLYERFQEEPRQVLSEMAGALGISGEDVKDIDYARKVNTATNDLALTRRRWRIQRTLPHASKRVARRLARAVALFTGSRAEEQRQKRERRAKEVAGSAGLGQDNAMLNARRGLGMEHYQSAYRLSVS